MEEQDGVEEDSVDECTGASERVLEDARQAFTLWAMIHSAVGKHHMAELSDRHWGNLVDRIAPVLNMGPHLFENASMCTVASAAARLLLHPWMFVKKLDKWLNPSWLVHYLNWPKIIEQGWGSFFIVLLRQISYKKLNRTSFGDVPVLRSPPDGLHTRSRLLASWVQAEMAIWHNNVCSGCWIGEVMYLGQPQQLWSSMWDAALIASRTFRLRPGVTRMGTDIFPARFGIRCAGGETLDDGRLIINCEDMEMSLAAPFDSDFSAIILAEPRKATAVCVTGPLRALHQSAGLQSIRKHLVEALDADAFAYVPVEGLDVARATAAALMSSLGAIRTLIVMEEWKLAEFAVVLDPATVVQRYGAYFGNWRAPLFEEVGGNLNMVFQQAACHKMVSSYEEQRGRKYSYIVWSRMDVFYMADHPPIHKSGQEDGLTVWIPRNEDWWGGGLNDRHAVLTRTAADIYLTRWYQVIDGSVVSFLSRPITDKSRETSSGETWLRQLLQKSSFELWRFDPVFFLLCCEPGPTCRHEQGSDREGSHIVRPRCAKYRDESITVIKTVTDGFSYLQMRGERWANSSSEEWVWTPPRAPVDNDVWKIWNAGHLLGFGSWKLGCCFGPSGPVSCWSWMLLRRCMTLKSR